MLELALCAMLTVLPDYLFRRYAQGKRIGKELTIYSVWFELRWGIIACLMLTVSLITVVLYNHPSTNAVTSFFRSVPILPEAGGRVAEIYVEMTDEVKAGDPLFRLDSAQQEAALTTARARVAEIDAELVVATTDIAAADGKVVEAKGALQQAVDQLETKSALNTKNPGLVPGRELEQLQVAIDARQGGVSAALANKAAVEAQVQTLLPAQRLSAEATLAEAQVALDKTTIRAGIDGRVEQFTLKVGDYVNPILRPAGILIPAGAGADMLVAGFNQLESKVLRVGMTAEVTCISKPFTVIPMVVTNVQDFIAAGQLRIGEQLIDPAQVLQPGTILVYLKPMFAGSIDDVPPGSSCIANAYTNNHDLLDSGKVTGLNAFFLHAVDAVGVVHAMVLRVQTLMLPIRILVLSGGH